MLGFAQKGIGVGIFLAALISFKFHHPPNKIFSPRVHNQRGPMCRKLPDSIPLFFFLFLVEIA